MSRGIIKLLVQAGDICSAEMSTDERIKVYSLIKVSVASLESEPEPGEFTKSYRRLLRQSISDFTDGDAVEDEGARIAKTLLVGEEACNRIDRLSAKSRRYGKCPNGHITVYAIDQKPHCAVADCTGPVYEVAIEVEYAKLQADLKAKQKEIKMLRAKIEESKYIPNVNDIDA